MRRLVFLVLAALLGVVAVWTRGGQTLFVLDRETLTTADDGFTLTFPQGLANVSLSEDGTTIALARNIFDDGETHTRLVVLDSQTAMARWSDVYPNSLCCSPPLVRMTPDGERVLGVGDVVRVYTDEGQVIFETDLPGDSFGLAAALSDDGRLAGVITSADRAFLYSAPDGQTLWSGEFEGGNGLALSGNGRLMLIAENKAAHLYDTASLHEIATWPLNYSGSLVVAGLSRDGTLGVTAGYVEAGQDADGNRLWELRVTLREIAASQQTEVTIPSLSLPELQVAPDGAWVRLVGRWRGGGVLIGRDGRILRVAARGERTPGELLARAEERTAWAAGSNIHITFGNRSTPQWARLAEGTAQGLWFTGEHLAALGSAQPLYPLSDRLWVWSVYNP
jgi:hypothetical protein